MGTDKWLSEKNVLATKPTALSLMPGTYVKKGEIQLLSNVLRPVHVCRLNKCRKLKEKEEREM